MVSSFISSVCSSILSPCCVMFHFISCLFLLCHLSWVVCRLVISVGIAYYLLPCPPSSLPTLQSTYLLSYLFLLHSLTSSSPSSFIHSPRFSLFIFAPSSLFLALSTTLINLSSLPSTRHWLFLSLSGCFSPSGCFFLSLSSTTSPHFPIPHHFSSSWLLSEV